MRKRTLLLALALIAVVGADTFIEHLAWAKSFGPGDHNIDFKVDGKERKAIVHVPPEAKSGKSLPLVIALHGGGMNMNHMQRYSGLDKTADKYGFIVAYPNGTGRGKWAKVATWNAGYCCGQAKKKGVDDVAMVKKLISEVDGKAGVDRKRVYVTGISNGGMLTYKVGCELSDEIAAIAPVAGAQSRSFSCKAKNPVAVLAIHGTQDQNVPFNGGVGSNSKSKVDNNSVADNLAMWRKVNGCATNAATKTSKNHRSAEYERWKECKGGAEVAELKVNGGGHEWPRKDDAQWTQLSGRGDDINDVIWDFFSQHTR
ncbi:MAG: poly(3-hydroxybutyrate) depolymerase [Deltaproteobacteria bacterium]|nr:poly(3-hydroxybutyrate) depolymerase [bacterium]MCB9477625.1 poly(3-hydroxybutyrate) depolymerase [Deltaproteobacteria bacterium]MCB9478587.1 poly(3-hydroxybutyrate) depolymerase [Deltaproteobacteria bacterium]MCB9488329.1 poly(3-hydroxybutyrate) depolymerase [Deltaproteobacteria bacterium]